MSECGIVLGNYGDGTIGLKTSIPGFDARVRADDFDTKKRSFNSEWPSVCKVKMIGIAAPVWKAIQYQEVTDLFNGVNWIYGRSAYSAWRLGPTEVPTGLTYVPVWEERRYDPSSKTFYDDFVFFPGGTFGSGVSQSGARSYFAGPGLMPNTLYIEPHWGSVNGSKADVFNITTAVANNVPPAMPPYPAFPTKPSDTATERCVFVVYANKMGDVA